MEVPSPKFDAFEVVPTTYKTVGQHNIRADILIPKKPALSGKRPVIARFHGGGLVVGDSLFADWWPEWLSDMAIEHGAIIISANYRLMPEATTAEVYEDLEDFWSWLFNSPPALKDALLASSHAEDLELNLDRIIATGESAGGLLSIQSALSHPSRIRAALASYPWIADAPEFQVPLPAPPFGVHTPRSVAEDLIAAVAKDKAPQSAIVTPERMAFAVSAIEHGLMGKLYTDGGSDDVLFPMRRLANPNVRLPPGGIAIIQGRQDSVVPAPVVERFVERAREVFGDGDDKVKLTMRDGEHAFDALARYDEEWLRQAFKGAVQTWLE